MESENIAEKPGLKRPFEKYLPPEEEVEKNLLEMPVEYLIRNGLVVFFEMYFHKELRGNKRDKRVRRIKETQTYIYRKLGQYDPSDLRSFLQREIPTLIFFRERGEEELPGEDKSFSARSRDAEKDHASLVIERTIVEYLRKIGYDERLVREVCESLNRTGYYVNRDSFRRRYYYWTVGGRHNIENSIQRIRNFQQEKKWVRENGRSL